MGDAKSIQVFDQNYEMMVPIGSFGSTRLSIRDHESFSDKLLGRRIYTDRLKGIGKSIIERFISQAIADKANQTDVFTISGNFKFISIMQRNVISISEGWN